MRLIDHVSSHWKQHILTMDGFGNFRTNTQFNKLRYFVENYLASTLLTKYSCNTDILFAGKLIALRQNRLYDFDCIKQCLSLSKISECINMDLIQSVCIIGDGYGYMAALIRKMYPNFCVISINLKEMLEVDKRYYALATRNDTGNTKFIQAGKFSCISYNENIDLFINIASMQEMTYDTINMYFDAIWSNQSERKYFYCCNREKKLLYGGELIEFDKYPWKKCDVIFDELCPWYQKYPSSFPPIWRKFDGPIWHRLVSI